MLSSTYAQKGRQAIGFGLSYGTEIESAGLGIKYQYNITLKSATPFPKCYLHKEKWTFDS